MYTYNDFLKLIFHCSNCLVSSSLFPMILKPLLKLGLMDQQGNLVMTMFPSRLDNKHFLFLLFFDNGIQLFLLLWLWRFTSGRLNFTNFIEIL